jgi:aminoglycoside 6'-N-acetyltransferase
MDWRVVAAPPRLPIMNNSYLLLNRDFLLKDGDLVVRPLRDAAADYEILTRWLQDPKVLEYYGGRDQCFSLSLVQAEFAPKVMAASGKTPCLIEFLKRPVGYLQFCLILPAEAEEYGYPADERIFGVDLFIGATELFGCGLGRRSLRCILSYLFTELGAQRVILDPRVDNIRAIRSYTAAGFRKVKLLPRHELHEGRLVDCWLMEAVPKAASS